MPTPRIKPTKTTTKPVSKSTASRPSTRSSAPKPAPMVPNRRAQRSTYAKMGATLNNMGKKK